MSKFYVGQKVLVTGSTWYPTGCARALVGKVLEVKSVTEDVILVYGENKIHRWRFNPSDLQPITETPETLTINGVEYIRKPEPVVEHEWKFGDVATHDDYGVGIVTCIDGGELEFDYKNGDYSTRLSTSSLTFLRRADLSV
ncbi:MAG: hypothetical protein [Caudoviricetes sp.]|nr:MAG: hypothetical protein [Caudoviricetes sp.]